ncbi:MAG: hypothetical protein ACRDQZ_08930 [Mycobacteriales bacterium]
MKVECQEAVENVPTDELLLGGSTWNPEERSLKYAWPDKNGKRARGGEVPIAAVPQAVLFAGREGYLTREAMARIIKGLTDVLAG